MSANKIRLLHLKGEKEEEKVKEKRSRQKNNSEAFHGFRFSRAHRHLSFIPLHSLLLTHSFACYLSLSLSLTYSLTHSTRKNSYALIAAATRKKNTHSRFLSLLNHQTHKKATEKKREGR
jgi:hypothetical protein